MPKNKVLLLTASLVFLSGCSDQPNNYPVFTQPQEMVPITTETVLEGKKTYLIPKEQAGSTDASKDIGGTLYNIVNQSDGQTPAANPSTTPIVFNGRATRYEFFCLAGECPKCPSSGDLMLKLSPDGTAELNHTAPCMKYGIQGCFSEDICAYILQGDYDAASGQIIFNTCSGSDQVSGSASYASGTSNGSVTCLSGGETRLTLSWDNNSSH